MVASASSFSSALAQSAIRSALTSLAEMRPSTGSPNASSASLSVDLIACSTRESPSGSCPERISNSPRLASTVAEFGDSARRLLKLLQRGRQLSLIEKDLSKIEVRVDRVRIALEWRGADGPRP